jgi:uncharacterized alkaline shock family protein YloU
LCGPREKEPDGPGPYNGPIEGHSVISSDVLATYAVDAAREVEGVTGIVESPLHRHRGVRVADDDGTVRIELHVAVEWGASVPELGAAVQRRVSEYLGRMADVVPAAVDVVVEDVGAPPAR